MGKLISPLDKSPQIPISHTIPPPSPTAAMTDFPELSLAPTWSDDAAEDAAEDVMGRMTKYNALMSLLKPRSPNTDGTQFGRFEVTTRSVQCDSALIQQLRVRVPVNTTDSDAEDESTENTGSSAPKGEKVAPKKGERVALNSSATWVAMGRRAGSC